MSYKNINKFPEKQENYFLKNSFDLKEKAASGTFGINGYGSVCFKAIFYGNIIKKINFKTKNADPLITELSSCLISLTGRNMDLFKSIYIVQKFLENHFNNPTPPEEISLLIVENAFMNLISDYLSKLKENIYIKKPKTIAVALSGGVDSSMTAKLLKDSGWNVFGITMKIIPENSTDKNFSELEYYKKYIEPAKLAARKLGIPHFIVNLEKEFEKNVVNPFCLDYFSGKTPNPCIECNKFIKFGKLLDISTYLGASFMATGHYCRIAKSTVSGLFMVKKGIDELKDQSYFFWKLDQKQISHIKTPLGKHLKKYISKESKRNFSFLIDKEESQDICFITGNKYQDFLKPDIEPEKKGKILNIKGEIIGYHNGYHFFTIGQRKGLGVSHKAPLYVKEIIPEKNIIVASEESFLYEKIMNLEKVNFISGNPPSKKFSSTVKIRYNSEEKPAIVNMISKNRAIVTFKLPQKAVTPGQSAVFYKNDIMIGGGIIS